MPQSGRFSLGLDCRNFLFTISMLRR
ncbi:hypothetical protein LINPERPRIM_LOCUS17143 [Linum perenne]